MMEEVTGIRRGGLIWRVDLDYSMRGRGGGLIDCRTRKEEDGRECCSLALMKLKQQGKTLRLATV